MEPGMFRGVEFAWVAIGAIAVLIVLGLAGLF